MNEQIELTSIKNELKSLTEFNDLIFEKNIQIKKLSDKKGNPLYKIIAFWRRNDLLPFFEDKKWMEIGFAQLIWLRILDDLREISFPVTKMKNVCEYFFKDAHIDNLPKKNLESNKKSFEKKALAGTLTETEKITIKRITDMLKHDPILHMLKYDINYLSNFISSSISLQEESFIYIFFNGRVSEFHGDNFAGHKENDISLLEPHIRLSITQYLREFIRDEELSILFMPKILNEDEMRVLYEMRNKNVKEIIIRSNNGKTRIESTNMGTISAEKALEIKELLGLKNYERIVIETMDEKTLSFKMTRKK